MMSRSGSCTVSSAGLFGKGRGCWLSVLCVCSSATYIYTYISLSINTSPTPRRKERTEEEGDGALEAGVEEGDGGVEAQEGGERDEAGGGQAADEVDGVARLVCLCVDGVGLWWWVGRSIDRGGTKNQILFESHQPPFTPTYLSQHRQRFEGLDGQVLANEEHAVVRKVEARAAAPVVPQRRVPAAVALLPCFVFCFFMGMWVGSSIVGVGGWVGVECMCAALALANPCKYAGAHTHPASAPVAG